MQHSSIEEIPIVQKADNIQTLTKGFSYDEKYVIDEQYLLRIFSSDTKHSRRKEFETIHQLSTYSNYVPEAIAFDTLKESDKSYMILSYLPGTDGEVALNHLMDEEQYSTGFEAGRELKKLHTLPAPSDYPTWFEVKQRKISKYFKELEKIDVDQGLKAMLENYIKERECLMENRPNRFQHDDFHPSNIVIENKRFSGLIDFQRMDWGDPIHDLQKLGFFSKQVSVPFTNGILDGYHEGKEISDSFWELFIFYSAVHIVSALVWGEKRSPEQYELLYERSLEVLRDHEDFNRIVPKWYTEKG
ncbi:aminoglycoside phosphotransferase family protein [Salimicrobium halophilum]|uniref:Predicted kinase, aminoglycoside phosphotransferase (APT) family n=1 Tax=Salimicrobium halophilum TaxID=86666 RepID=A0A1G8RFG5_9BACI|nr:aminoglycoside phosphotransferase family protein [Salimicrobium halophilum]SDJ15702.1 Predicted kinase, aminoglycoside phosphotransferase (APT) family [Salimicrobium halophilum]